MKFPSIKGSFANAGKAIERFPFVVGDAFIGALVAILLVNFSNNPDQIKEVFIKILMLTLAGLPLFFSLEILAERREWFRKKKVLIHCTAVLVLVIYYFSLFELERKGVGIKHMLITLGLFFLVTFAPFTKRGEAEEFWQYNRSLVVALSKSFISTFVLFIGVVIALAGITYLLEIEFSRSVYLTIFIIVMGFINILIFLGETPEGATDKIEDYPKFMAILIRNILVPLVILYLGILYIYAGKIILEQSWPKGGVSGFILGFAAVGILSMLLIYPVRERIEGRVVQAYLKTFYPFVLPLTIMLFLAVFRRVSEYGVTEIRYFGLLGGPWLAAMCLYFIFSTSKHIRVIPVSLCLISVLSAFGPWGFLSVSEHSQISRLKRILTRNNILVNEKIQKAQLRVPPEDQGEISNIVRYLRRVHGLHGIKLWFCGKISAFDPPERVAEEIGIPYIPYYLRLEDKSSHRRYFNFSSMLTASLNISGYDHYVIFESWSGPKFMKHIAIGEKMYQLTMAEGTEKLSLLRDEDEQRVGELDLKLLIDKLMEEYYLLTHVRMEIPQEKMILESDNRDVKMKIHVSEIYGERVAKTNVITHLRAHIFLKIK